MGPGTRHNPFARIGGGSFCVRNENYFLNREFECAGGEAASQGGLDQQEPEVTNDPPWRLADLSFVPSGNGQEGATINGVEVVGDIGLSPPMALSGATLTRGRSCSELSVRKAKAGAAVESITAPPGSSATF
jgi:hypothetical protein